MGERGAVVSRRAPFCTALALSTLSPPKKNTPGCPVCLEPFTPAGTHRVCALKGCGHLFGKGCAVTAVRAAGRCPLCQARARPADVLVLFNGAGLRVGPGGGGGGGGGAGENAADTSRRVAALEASLARARAEAADAKREARRLARLNGRLVALCGGGVPPAPAAPAAAPAGPLPALASLPMDADAAPTLLARMDIIGASAVGVCAAGGVAVVGCEADGPAGRATLLVLSLLAPATPARAIALPPVTGDRPAWLPGMPRPRRVVSLALHAPAAAGTAGRAAVLLDRARVVILDLRSGSVVASWPAGMERDQPTGLVRGDQPSDLVWLGGGVAVATFTPPGRAWAVFDLAAPGPGRFGRAPTPEEGAEVAAAAAADAAGRGAFLARLPPSHVPREGGGLEEVAVDGGGRAGATRPGAAATLRRGQVCLYRLAPVLGV